MGPDAVIEVGISDDVEWIVTCLDPVDLLT
jgi:hypothetical protein